MPSRISERYWDSFVSWAVRSLTIFASSAPGAAQHCLRLYPIGNIDQHVYCAHEFASLIADRIRMRLHRKSPAIRSFERARF